MTFLKLSLRNIHDDSSSEMADHHQPIICDATVIRTEDFSIESQSFFYCITTAHSYIYIFEKKNDEMNSKIMWQPY